MNISKKLVVGLFFVLASSLFMGAIFEKSGVKLKVIKAGVDDKGNPVCVNKSQVYLFKKDQENAQIIRNLNDVNNNLSSKISD